MAHSVHIIYIYIYGIFKDLTNRPLAHTPNPQPTVYVSEFLSFGGERGCLGYAVPGVCWVSLRYLLTFTIKINSKVLLFQGSKVTNNPFKVSKATWSYSQVLG